MKLLITGFDPFNDETINPSYEAIKQLPDTINSISIFKRELPTQFEQASTELFKLIDEIKPDVVILTGQAGGRAEISLEKVALNIMDATIKDNGGIMPKDEKIINDGDNAYFSNLDLRTLSTNLSNDNILNKISYNAGTFVCNSTYYKLLHKIHTEHLNIKGLFVHVPFIPEQVKGQHHGKPSMALSEIVRALECIIKSL